MSSGRFIFLFLASSPLLLLFGAFQIICFVLVPLIFWPIFLIYALVDFAQGRRDVVQTAATGMLSFWLIGIEAYLMDVWDVDLEDEIGKWVRGIMEPEHD